jgi:hypothetical protein
VSFLPRRLWQPDCSEREFRAALARAMGRRRVPWTCTQIVRYLVTAQRLGHKVFGLERGECQARIAFFLGVRRETVWYWMQQLALAGVVKRWEQYRSEKVLVPEVDDYVWVARRMQDVVELVRGSPMMAWALLSLVAGAAVAAGDKLGTRHWAPRRGVVAVRDSHRGRSPIVNFPVLPKVSVQSREPDWWLALLDSATVSAA